MSPSRSAKVIILSSGQALTSLVGLVSTAILARVLLTLDLATFRKTLLASAFAVPFVTMGMDQALYFFLPGEQKRSRTILMENLVLLLAGGAILSLFIVLGGNRLLAWYFENPDLATTVLLYAPVPIFLLPSMALAACLMARDRTEQVAMFNVASRLVMLAFVVLPVLLWAARPDVAVAGYTAGVIVCALPALALMFRACPVGPWRPTLAGMGAQLRFTLPLGVASLISGICVTIDQVLVGRYCTNDQFAVYSLGAFEIPLIGVLTGSIGSVVLVEHAQFHREGRTEDMVRLIHLAMVKSGLFLLPAMAFLLCVAPELMRLLFGEQYAGSAAPFRVYLLMLPIRTMTFGSVLKATGNSHHILIQSILSLIAAASAAWVGISLFGPVGAAIGMVSTLYLIALPYWMVSISAAVKTPVRRLLPWGEMARLLTASFLPCVAVVPVLWAVPMPDWAVPLPDIARLVLAGAVYGVLVLPCLALIAKVSPATLMQHVYGLRSTYLRDEKTLPGSVDSAALDKP